MSRHIEVSKAVELCDEFYFNEETCSVKGLFDSAPSIDIVRCKECRFYDENDRGYCDLQSIDGWKADDFCSYGCRKEE